MKEPNIPKPTRSAVRFVVATARSRIIAMSTRGSAWRRSKATQAAPSTTAPANSARIGGEPQPQEFASLTPTSSDTRVADSRPAPIQSILAGLLIGDSGTQRNVATIATAMNTSPSQKIHS
jgi:hypothetical protein